VVTDARGNLHAADGGFAGRVRGDAECGSLAEVELPTFDPDPDERESRQAFFDERVIYYPPEFRQTYAELRERLDQIAPGTLVVPPHDMTAEEIQDVLERGTFTVSASGVVEMSSNLRPGFCHDNAVEDASEDPDLMIGSGFALSDDGLWRHHSWLLRGDTIIETTEPRDAYFGATFDPDDF
jgi:hypothetical protein